LGLHDEIQPAKAKAILRERLVDLRTDFALRATRTDVSDDADDFANGVRLVRHRHDHEPLSDRIGAGKISAS
jgi:hypothetical protein